MKWMNYGGVNVDELALGTCKSLSRGSGPSKSHRNALSPFGLRFLVLFFLEYTII